MNGNERGGMNLFVPQGFANGRELPKIIPASRELDFEAWVGAAEEPEVAFGRISWDAAQEPVSYVRIPLSIADNAHHHHHHRHSHRHLGSLPELARFFAERVWCLKRPRLLISVVGYSAPTNYKQHTILFLPVLNELKLCMDT